MGPRSDERGNMTLTIATTIQHSLQWGRAQMSAEILLQVPGPQGGLHPSMGPRPDERGNPSPDAGTRSAPHHPSMGPRSDERGNPADSSGRANVCAFAFNGAALR